MYVYIYIYIYIYIYAYIHIHKYIVPEIPEWEVENIGLRKLPSVFLWHIHISTCADAHAHMLVERFAEPASAALG
jgi:hypothetical protein